VREKALAGLVGPHPFLEHRLFNPAHRFHLGNAGIGYAIHVAIEQALLVGRGEIAVIRHALVVVMRDEIENVLLQIGARAADGGDLVLPNHFRERQPELRRAHRAGQRNEHLAAFRQMRLVAFGGIHQSGGVEMTVMMGDEIADRGTHPRMLKDCRPDAKEFGRRASTFLERAAPSSPADGSCA
jgi:hypothetical protein